MIRRSPLPRCPAQFRLFGKPTTMSPERRKPPQHVSHGPLARLELEGFEPPTLGSVGKFHTQHLGRCHNEANGILRKPCTHVRR